MFPSSGAANEPSASHTPAPTQPQPTHPPTTTIDDATTLAEAEAAYFEAYEVGRDFGRSPDDPINESLIRTHFTQNNLELALENLRLTREGNYVAVENPDNPSFAQTYGDIEFTSERRDEVSLTVCEFYSERLYSRGTAPDGSDTLVRDNPVTTIIRVGLVLEDGRWKSATGNASEEVRDEVERCTTAS